MEDAEVLRRSIEDHIEWLLEHKISAVATAASTIESSGMEEWYEACDPTANPLIDAKAALEAAEAKYQEGKEALEKKKKLRAMVPWRPGFGGIRSGLGRA